MTIWTSLAFAQTPRKYALLIGVSDYSRGVDEDEEWWNLNSKSDIEAIRQVLVQKFNFKPNEIQSLLTKQQTTKQSILNAFNRLEKNVKAGDIVYLHYSGHGSQILDDNGDEIDGLDESLIPSDYKTRRDGSNNIRDDEIGEFLTGLKAKNPANVTFIFDSCFSGTITRSGRQLVRGESYQGAIPNQNPNAASEDSSGLITSGILGQNFVLITATRSDQTAKETDNDSNGKMGMLTYSLIKAFNDATPNTTYRDVFDRLQGIVLQRVEAQSPQIEGNSDAVLLKGLANPTEPYFLVLNDAKNNPVLQAGSLQGMTKGSKFAIFPSGTKSKNESKKLADAEIIQLNSVNSMLKLSKPVNPKLLQSSRAFEFERVYNDNALKIKFSENLLSEEVFSQIKKIPFVKLTNIDDWDLSLKTGEIGLLLERNDGTIVSDIKNDENFFSNFKSVLEKEFRFKAVSSLENKSIDLKIEVRIIPVEVELNERGNVSKILSDKQLQKNNNGIVELKEGDFVTLEARNKGAENAWITILSLKSDGKISPMFPHPKVSKFENKILADGEWKRIPMPFVYRITAPIGKEIYKVIATPEPTDFSPLLDFETASSNSEKTRDAAKTPLGSMLRAATLATRSESTSSAPSNWATTEVVFEVKKK